jgi:hypothetical protein
VVARAAHIGAPEDADDDRWLIGHCLVTGLRIGDRGGRWHSGQCMTA